MSPPSDQLRRRSFLAYCGSLGLGSTLFPGVLWAESEEAQEAIELAAREVEAGNEQVPRAPQRQGAAQGGAHEEPGHQGEQSEPFEQQDRDGREAGGRAEQVDLRDLREAQLSAQERRAHRAWYRSVVCAMPNALFVHGERRLAPVFPLVWPCTLSCSVAPSPLSRHRRLPFSGHRIGQGTVGC